MTRLLPKRILSEIKTLIVKSGSKPRKIRFGLLKGANMWLDYAYQTQLYLGLWEREIAHWLEMFSKGINTAIDVGAGVGEYTLYFALRTPSKVIFAVEPNEESRRLLKENLKLNNSLANCQAHILSQYIGAENVGNQCTLDSLLPQIKAPCLVKVDIEGGELDLLHGAKDLLKIPKTRWIIEAHSKDLETQCIRILKESNYRVRIIPKAWWRLFIPEQRPIPHNQWLVAEKNSCPK